MSVARAHPFRLCVDRGRAGGGVLRFSRTDSVTSSYKYLTMTTDKQFAMANAAEGRDDEM